MITIRPAGNHDSAAIAALLGELGYPASAKAIPARLSHLRESDAPTLVAEASGKVVGMVTIHLVPVIIEDQPVAQLTSLAVLEAARGTWCQSCQLSQSQAASYWPNCHDWPNCPN